MAQANTKITTAALTPPIGNAELQESVRKAGARLRTETAGCKFDLQSAEAIIDADISSGLLEQARYWLGVAEYLCGDTQCTDYGVPLSAEYALVAFAALRRFMLDAGMPSDLLM